MKKIISYKLRHSDQEVLTRTLGNYPHYSLVVDNNLEKLLAVDLDEVAGCFVFVDESMDMNKFESLLKHFHKKSLNIILKYKDFDYLMICHKFKVSSVFEGKMSENECENSLVRIDLLAETRNHNIPVREVMDLISSPVKIKTNVELYNSLAIYFNSFESVHNFCLIEVQDENLNKIGRMDINSALETITNVEVPRKYIGHEIEVKNEDSRIDILTPIFCPDKKRVWLYISLNSTDKDYILNTLLYKYLENVLIYRMNKAKEQSLEKLASTDDVTGLFNQRKLSQDLESAVAHHEKHDKTFSIMFLDVDHFKSVNDNYGHVIGSKLLTDIGDVLSLILRSSDHIYRYGGDEFVVIMPTVDVKTVHEIATRLLSKIKNKKFDIGNGETYTLSISIGIAEYPTDAKSALEIIRFADEMMYMSKRSGRGKVFHINEVEHVDADSK